MPRRKKPAILELIMNNPGIDSFELAHALTEEGFKVPDPSSGGLTQFINHNIGDHVRIEKSRGRRARFFPEVF
jgi:anti-sigma regulatory factor (Ser/Thr protein kinase)